MINNDNRYTTISIGNCEDIDYKIYIYDRHINSIISSFHGIQIYPNNKNRNIVRMVIEIPSNTIHKMEINKSIKLNPITYDKKNGKIRIVNYKGGYPANYGAIPQTWENSVEEDNVIGLKGDNDPLDCFDISDIEVTPGEIINIKVLGAIAMIDDGRTDWKIIGINCKDQMSIFYDDISEIPNIMLDGIIDFLRNYKKDTTGKENTFHKDIIWSGEQSIKLIERQHNEWCKLLNMNDKQKNDEIRSIRLDISLNINEIME